MKSSCALLVMVAVVLGSPVAAGAQALTGGPEIFVAPVGLEPGGWQARLAAGTDGGLLDTWIYDGPLKARAVSPAGVPLGTTQQLGAGFQSPTLAQLAALGPGRFVAVWSARLSSSPPAITTVLAQIVDAAGNPLLPSPLVLAEDGRAMDVIADGAGGFFVAWHAVEAAEVRIGHFDGGGNPIAAEVAIGAARLQGLMATLLPGGGAVLTWFSRGFNAEPPQEIALRVVLPDGSSAGGISLISQLATADVLTLPEVSADATGRFVVAWGELSRSTERFRIQARRFTADGEPRGEAILIRETGFFTGAYPSDVAARPDGSFLVLWGEQYDVFARAFDPSGNPLGEAFAVHETREGEQYPGGAAATAEGWALSWGRSQGAQPGLYNRRFTLSCGTAAGLCLQDGRFLATVEWHVPATGARGQGTPVSRTRDTGTFWFFDPANIELVVKVLDGTGINGHFWVFYGSLSDVAYDLTVTDTRTGQQRTYHNPAGTLASRADTEAF